MRKSLVAGIGFFVLGILATIGLQSALSPLAAVGATSSETYRLLNLFGDVFDRVRTDYVEKPDDEKLIETAINGMLTALDPHSSFMNAKRFRDMQVHTRGEFGGLGIEVTMEKGVVKVVAPIDDTPASKAGIRAGDQIVRINGELTKSMTLMDAVKKLRGKKGTRVTITIYRQGWPEPRDFVLVRDVIPLHSVRSMMLEPHLLYVRITNFQANTTRDFVQALNRAGKQHSLDGLLLDLRDNPGGLLDQAIKVADVFIDRGIIVSTRGRDPEQNMRFEAHKGNSRYSFPLVVLVNGGSASASEIVAGALQDHKRAIIVGTETFGKGSVQTIIPMPNGAGIRLTTARYYTPSGRSIQETGILPDVIIPFTIPAKAGKQPRQWSIREKDLPHHFTNKAGKRDGKDGEEEQGQEKKKVAERLSRDNQLRTAYIILKSLKIMLEEKHPAAGKKEDNSRADVKKNRNRART